MNVESKDFAIGRIPITRTWPQVDGGRFPVKAFQGEVITFGATAFREGHDQIAVELLLTSPSGKTTIHSMLPGPYGLDQWTVTLQLGETGRYRYQVSAWDDSYHTWLHNAEIKIKAGIEGKLVGPVSVHEMYEA